MSGQRYQNILVGVDGTDQANEAFKKQLKWHDAIRESLCSEYHRSADPHDDGICSFRYNDH